MKIAFFDFDGTISTHDSLKLFTQFAVGRANYWRGIVFLSPMLALYALKIIPNYRAKQLFMAHFFKGMPEATFKKLATTFATDILPSFIRPRALACIQQHMREQTTVVVVSASAEDWLKPWCEQLSLPLIGTQLEFSDHKVTGRFASNNCYGQEKVNRIKAQYTLEHYDEIFAYGDSGGDKAMLGIAHHPYYKPFRT